MICSVCLPWSLHFPQMLLAFWDCTLGFKNKDLVDCPCSCRVCKSLSLKGFLEWEEDHRTELCSGRAVLWDTDWKAICKVGARWGCLWDTSAHTGSPRLSTFWTRGALCYAERAVETFLLDHSTLLLPTPADSMPRASFCSARKTGFQ